ncbi:7374_t:CDS:2, partial [Ambispora leptoticha]
IHQAQTEQEPTYTAYIKNINYSMGCETEFNNSNKENIEPISLISSHQDSNDNNSDTSENNNLHQSALNEFQWFCHDLEKLLEENDPVLDKSVELMATIINAEVKESGYRSLQLLGVDKDQAIDLKRYDKEDQGTTYIIM